MNSVARIVSNTRKFDQGLTHVQHDILHRLDVPERDAMHDRLHVSVWNGTDISVGDVPVELVGVGGWSSSFAFC